MAQPPFFYNYMNQALSGVEPNMLHVLDSEQGRFFQRYLLKKAISVLKWRVPANWNKDYFLYVLYCYGYAAVINTNAYGVIPQICTLSGYNVFYQPTHAIIANPYLSGIKTPRIGSECTLIKLQPDYCGVMDICAHYAAKMALISSSIDSNLFNSRVAYVFFASNEASAKTFKTLADDIASGHAATVVDKKMKNADGSLDYEIFNRDVKNSYIVSDLISDLRKIEAEFDTKIGIPNANTDKRERLIKDEVNANNVETESLVDMWLDNIKLGIAQTRELFGKLDLSAEWRCDRASICDSGGNV